jgi:hypothetical protein
VTWLLVLEMGVDGVLEDCPKFWISIVTVSLASMGELRA